MVVATVGVAMVLGVWILRGEADPPTDAMPTSPGSSVVVSDASITTGLSPPMPDIPWVLIFDDGLDGVVVVDPNDPAGSEAVQVEGQRPGDQPYRLTVVDGRLIVGWGEIYAVDVRSGESALVGKATAYVPAAEPERLWMIDYSGGRIGEGTLRAWQVSTSGDALISPVEIKTDGVPEMGVPSGLAIETESGISLWDATLGEVGDPLGPSAGFVSDVTMWSGSALAWCEDLCGRLHITEMPSGADQVVIHPDGEEIRFIARSARFSADGRYLAAPTKNGDVVVHDRDTGRSHVAFRLPASNSATVDWVQSGHVLFASTILENGVTSRIAHHRIEGGLTETVDVSVTVGQTFVVVNEEEARSFLAASAG
jgi:hypothetical protein